MKLKPNGRVWDIYWRGRWQAQTHDWNDFRAQQPERLYSVGSGPSMAEQNLAPLAQSPAVLLNGAISLVLNGVVPEPFAVMVEDARFILERADMLRQLPAGTPLCLVGPALQALGEVDPGLYSRFKLYFMQGFDSHYGEAKRILTEADAPFYRTDGQLMLSLDLSIGHFGCGTVMYSGVQMGFHVRAKQLCLVGFDMTNLNQPRFYETAQNAAWTGLAKAYQNRILPAFELAVKTANEFGMSIENCSHTSILPTELLPFNDCLMPAANRNLL
ncbi:hypothetical protein [Saccharospirillum mangrovi]|uniref:hypothetical protein n=1 Tax=Saccharospirillum mangrovi TaxID=2161747 RepID=UPI00130097F0|nr:hypothetical protein [Saccharospirillum mangrovi]